MFDHPLAHRLNAEIAARTASGLERTLLPIQIRDGARLTVNGRDMLNFSSNDFLGLGVDRAAAAELARLSATRGCGAGASRLVTGTTASVLSAEETLATYFGFESCLILGSGFLANLTLISTLFSAKDTLILDKRAHTSTMAGVRHSGAAFHTFRHNRLSHLEKLLLTHPASAVLTESLFSMDGDSPDFAALADLKRRFGFVSIVDEAHAVGVLGPGGRGLSTGVADIAIGTFGKAFGLFGAFLLLPRVVREYLINFGQGFIYTTALPPWFGDMAAYMLARVNTADNRRAHLAAMAELARARLAEAEFDVAGSAHILAVRVGDENRCQHLAQALRDAGILVFAARYPTVPLGRAILRVCLTSDHSPAHITRLRDALVKANRSIP